MSRVFARFPPGISRSCSASAFSTSSSVHRGVSRGKAPQKSPPKASAKSTPRASSKELSKLPPRALEFRNASRPRMHVKSDGNQRSRVEAASAIIRKKAQDPNVNLLAPVHTPDDPEGVLKPDHPAASILQNSSIVVQRQLEAMNVLVGWEQANRYVILGPQGNHVGYLVEHDGGIGETFSRQTFRTHRALTAHVFDKREQEVLRVHRPFSWANSTIGVYDSFDPTASQTVPKQRSKNWSIGSSMPLIGAAQQQWAPLHRKYEMFTRVPRDAAQSRSESPVLDLPDDFEFRDRKTHLLSRFAYVDEKAFSWDFTLRGNGREPIGSVNRAWRGAAQEILTDTGVYALRMDSVALANNASLAQNAESQQTMPAPRGMSLDERAVMLATAVSIDFDYFSRHSSTLGGWIPIPIWIPGIGGEAVAGGAGLGLGEIGAAEGLGAAGSVGAFSALHQGRKLQENDWGKEDPWDKGSTGSGASGGDGGADGGGDGGGFDIGGFF